MFKLQKVKTSKLKLNKWQIEWVPKNPRFLKDERFEKLKKSIQEAPEMLELREVIAYDNNWELVVIWGNMRLRALRDLKIKEVMTKVLDTDTTADKLREYVIKDNVEFWNNDMDILANEWDSEELEEWGMEIDFEDIGEEEEEKEWEDEVPEVQENIIVEKWDIFQLWEHRLLCWDSAKIEEVEKLMDWEIMDTCYTDPPYWISYKGKWQTGITKWNNFWEILWDWNEQVAIDVYNLIATLNIKNIYYWWANFYTNILNNWNSWIIWNKETVWENYSDCELCYTNKPWRLKMVTHQWHWMIKASEHWQARVHPTQKPVFLAEYCIWLDKDVKNVLDLFWWSWSTLIASEKTNRKCYMMELDEKYIQVILKRYYNYTNGEKEIKCLNRDLDLSSILK